jgi:hypothetical protein
MYKKGRTNRLMMVLGGMCLISLMLTVPAVTSHAGKPSSDGIDRATLYWTGAWKANLSYNIADVVQYEGNNYLCGAEHTSSLSTIPSDDPNHWELMALKGDKGDTGVVGPQGPQGLQGQQGVQGDAGAVGLAGPQGVQGDKGNTGTVGPAGPQGAQGDKGDTGAVGSQGPQGDIGPAGPQGVPGTSLWSDGGEGIIKTDDNVGIGVGVMIPGAALEVDGGIKIADDKDPCDLQKAGTLKWTGYQLMFCDGIQWTAIPLQGLVGSYGTISYQGLVWLDRNLGAQRVATDLRDASAFGDLYQWGRPTDGHQIRTSETTTELSPGDIPGHNKFITVQSASLGDWRQTPNSDLWSSDTGQNNPCPSGFRLPTLSEMQLLQQQDPNEVAEVLHLASAGIRNGYDGQISDPPPQFTETCLWTSTPGGMDNEFIMGYFVSGDDIQVYGDLFDMARGEGCSVRCVQDN